MLKTLLITASIIILATIGIGIYLQPNDFNGCPTTPEAASAQHCHTADAIVAVSGGDTTARAKKAIDLYKNGWGKKIIFSGAAKDKSGPSNAAAMRTIAVNSGVDKDDIMIDEYSDTTEENASNSQKIFSDNNIDSIILVTSGYHQRRASLEFNKYAGDVTVYNDPVANDNDWSSYVWWLSPRGWWLAIGEIVKIGIFYVSGVTL